MSIKKEDVIGRILTATDEQLVTIDAVLCGGSAYNIEDTAVVTQKAAATMLGKKHYTTVSRMIRKGLLRGVPTPSGLLRVARQSVSDYLKGLTVVAPKRPTEVQRAYHKDLSAKMRKRNHTTKRKADKA